jgi:transcriptional regulator with XRE-family HTH domain
MILGPPRPEESQSLRTRVPEQERSRNTRRALWYGYSRAIELPIREREDHYMSPTMAKEHTKKKTQGAKDMAIGARIRQLREQKGFSQGDIERLTGLLRCYTSRVENGHTVPSLETLERFAAALGIPLYELFYTGGEPPPTPNLSPRKSLEELAEEEGKQGADARFLLKLKALLERVAETDRQVLLSLAKKLATR